VSLFATKGKKSRVGREFHHREVVTTGKAAATSEA
jgi:hypothetical protein